MTKPAQDHTAAPISPQGQDKEAKQSWDDEGGSLHPDETQAAVPLTEPTDPGEDANEPQPPPAADVRAIYTNDRDPGDALPGRPGT